MQWLAESSLSSPGINGLSTRYTFLPCSNGWAAQRVNRVVVAILSVVVCAIVAITIVVIVLIVIAAGVSRAVVILVFLLIVCRLVFNVVIL
jgi:hypothetical protein